ncbi:MAG: O-linked N-acetylglucosamine transferase, SPINDLY family protein, partial [Planctomycetota bacterium]
EEVVHLIEQDEIDILVEIGGHTTDNRLGLMAYKPAPIQVDYGGFNTSGMEQIDYRLTDSLLDPPELRRFYIEESVCLPGGLFCYRPPEFAPPVGPLPAKRNGFVTFGSFSNGIKINTSTLSLWAQVLKKTENSRLLLKFRGGDDRYLQEHYLSQLERMGVSGDRTTICGWRPPADHLDLYNQVDIALDTYPFGGCMTTLEGLWMGVPVVSLVGENSLLSRTGLSILSRLDMSFFAASAPDEYVSKAVALAHKPDALAGIRNSLRQRMAASTLCNGRYYARCLEEAYREMWCKWCRTRPAAAPGQKRETPGRRQPAETSAQDGVLDFFISQNSALQFAVFKAGLPAALLEAGQAVKVGKAAEAAALLNDQAVSAVEQLVTDDPGRTDALFMLAALFAKVGDIRKAERYYKEVLAQQPHALVLFELANICRDTGRLSEAVRYQEQAVELSPDSPELRTTLAEYIIRMGRAQEGIDLLRKAVEASPDKVNHSKYLWHLHQAPRLDQRELFEEHRRWARIHAPMSMARTSHDNSRDPDRRLNVGYVSPDFCGHSVAYFFEPLLDAHNRETVQVYGYGDISCPDQVTEHLKSKFDRYRNICGLDDDRVARMIEQDRIDILVDLAGHTSGNRLGVFARKPAPVQVTYLGFPDTTGMEQIDYRLTDELADLPEAQEFHTEKLVYLPAGFLCYKPPGFAPPVGPLPAIERGYFTFGSFNNNCKIQPDMMELWAQILKAKEKSRLLLKFGGGDDEAVKGHYLGEFEGLGIAPDRVTICGRKPTIEHLEMYGQVDMALDTYPYNGTTTTCEAMWMGVPTVSLVGSSHASRVGLSLLSRVGLKDFAASTAEEYVGKAVAFSGELENLAKIRTFLRGMMFNSPLCDRKSFTRSLEAAYRKMWRQWCGGSAAGLLHSIDSESLCPSTSKQVAPNQEAGSKHSR